MDIIPFSKNDHLHFVGVKKVTTEVSWGGDSGLIKHFENGHHPVLILKKEFILWMLKKSHNGS